jgi:hypothetical protein
VLGRFKTSRERELSERPTTVSSLVFDFRELSAHAAEVVRKPVVIAIDELDKIDDAKAVKKLLRDVKGIFEVPGVFFFVSVSDEAARALELGSVSGRDEFHSSFYTVIELHPLPPDACADVSFGHRRSLGELEVGRIAAQENDEVAEGAESANSLRSAGAEEDDV